MTQSASAPRRSMTREAPHRTSDRFFAAKAAAKSACEDLVHDIRHSHLHDSARGDLLRAAERVEHDLHDITLETVDGRDRIEHLEKEIQHLRLAERWVASAERVVTRLGTNGSRSLRDQVLEAQDAVLWCVRAHEWNGQLTATLAQLERIVKDAEATAARSAS